MTRHSTNDTELFRKMTSLIFMDKISPFGHCLIRACVRSQGKGSYKHKALISSGSYLLNEEKGAKKKALISIQALIKVGSYKHTTTVPL